MIDSTQVTEIRAMIASLTAAALCGDWESDTISVLQLMGRNALQARDVPAAMEMISLLQHFAPRIPVLKLENEFKENTALRSGLFWGESSKLILLLDISAGGLDEVACWIADNLPSAKIKSMPGLLAIPFTVEKKGHDDSAQNVLFPDWVTVFYPYSRAENAFPILTLRSVLSHDAFSDGWVEAAIERLGFYGLPRNESSKVF